MTNAGKLHALKVSRLEEGVTLEQAQAVCERYFWKNQAAPTIAHEMQLDHKLVCRILDGKVWPAALQYWHLLGETMTTGEVISPSPQCLPSPAHHPGADPPA